MDTLLISTDDLTESDVAELAHLLTEDASVESAAHTAQQGQPGRIEPVTVGLLVTGFLLGTGVLTKIVDWWAARSDCLLVIDARNSELRITQRCDLTGYRGKTVVISDNETQVIVSREKGAIELDDVMRAVSTGGDLIQRLVAGSHPGAIEKTPVDPAITAGL